MADITTPRISDVDRIENMAFDLWALLRAVSARLNEIESDAGSIDSDGCSELRRLLAHGIEQAHAIGEAVSAEIAHG